jgi:hypothetical protein
VKYATNVPPSEIHPNLKIKEGEVKILVECCHCYDTGNGLFSDGRPCRDIPVSKAFGLWVMTVNPSSSGGKAFFPSVVIFTPKPGLFDRFFNPGSSSSDA